MPIANLLPTSPIQDSAAAETLLEIAFLMTAVDGRLEPQEIAAFGEIAARVSGTSVSAIDPAELTRRFAVASEPAAITARVRAIAPTLPAALREVTFKIAIGLALVDDDASPLEDELVGVLFDSLGLEPGRAEELAAEARMIMAVKA
ncbi:MAG TPA: TerB family tellurite resistance protein [Labilithrix sp.]|jgi:hypothetical protein